MPILPLFGVVCLLLNIGVIRLLPSDRWAWSDDRGYINCAKEKYILPSNQHRWMENWKITYDSDSCDKNGWQYAVDFPRFRIYFILQFALCAGTNISRLLIYLFFSTLCLVNLLVLAPYETQINVLNLSLKLHV